MKINDEERILWVNTLTGQHTNIVLIPESLKKKKKKKNERKKERKKKGCS